ncbi:MAG: hypothetical protein JXR96_11685 [Deltaproteobacteria bacterium]|nr:hypothetical protein [Deltaproteobacteria bacterium]
MKARIARTVRTSGLISACLVLGLAGSVKAEGSPETGTNQGLSCLTRLYVDIVDPGSETFVWQGQGDVEVTSPAYDDMGVFSSGQTITPRAGLAGAYRVEPVEDQFLKDEYGLMVEIYDWDLTVFDGDGGALVGRVWSLVWNFSAPYYEEVDATDADFFVLVPGGTPGETAVIQIDFEGLAGFIWRLAVNPRGAEVGGEYPGHSVPSTGGNFSMHGEYAIYLNPPELADYTHTPPELDLFAFQGGATGCNAIVEGEGGAFVFETNVEGSYHLVCDLNGDGMLDKTDLEDLYLFGDAVPGENEIAWDATHDGAGVAYGEYECQLEVAVAQIHYVAEDVETCYPGMRVYELEADLDRRPLVMFWNDSLVQQDAVTWQNGDVPAETSGFEGVESGPFGQEPVPHGQINPGDARAWGDFNEDGLSKGDETLLDTLSYLDSVRSEVVIVRVLDPDADSDADGLSDYEELCFLGCDPDDEDGDGDGVIDPLETDEGNPRDTDEDGLPDCMDDDDDGDGVLTAEEDTNGNGDLFDDDSDQDGTPDFLDNDGPQDSDGDHVPDAEDNCPGVANEDQSDLDADELGDACDPDADGDGIGAELDCDDLDDEVSEAGTWYLDEDGDGYGADGQTTEACEQPDGYAARGGDNCPEVDNPDQADSDGDGVGDACEDGGDKAGCSCGAAGPSGGLIYLLGLLALGLIRRR